MKEKPSNYLAWSIVNLVAALVCCSPIGLIFGIVATVKSCAVDSKYSEGRLAEAQACSQYAKVCNIVGTISLVLMLLLCMVLYVLPHLVPLYETGSPKMDASGVPMRLDIGGFLKIP